MKGFILNVCMMPLVYNINTYILLLILLVCRQTLEPVSVVTRIRDENLVFVDMWGEFFIHMPQNLQIHQTMLRFTALRAMWVAEYNPGTKFLFCRVLIPDVLIRIGGIDLVYWQ